jgi:cytochrome P450
MAEYSVIELLRNLFTLNYLLLLIAALLTFAVSYQVIYNHFFHPLRDYPGPFLAGVTRIWVAYHNYIEDETAVCWELVKKYGQLISSWRETPRLTRSAGPIVRISPNLLLVAKAEYIPEIYHRKSVKTNHYNLLGFGQTPSVFHSIEHADHVARRRMVASAYNFSGTKGLEQALDRRTSKWIAELKRRFSGGESFNLSSWTTFLTIDMIGEIGFGKDLGCVENGCDTEGFDKGFKAGLFAFGFVTRMHVVAGWVQWSFMGRFFEWQVPRDQTVGVLMRFGRKAIKDRMEETGIGEKKERSNDMLQRYVAALVRRLGLS